MLSASEKAIWVYVLALLRRESRIEIIVESDDEENGLTAEAINELELIAQFGIVR